MREFHEGNALTVTARFRADGDPVIPTTVHYKLVNVTHNDVLVDWTSVVPASTVEIDLSALILEVQSSGRRYEIFEATVVADKDTEDQMVDVQRFRLKNVQAIS